MFRRTALTVACAIALALAGCAADPTMPGENGPGQSTASMPVASAPSASSSDVLPGLSAACSTVIAAQAAIYAELAKALGGEAVTADGVHAVFDDIGPDVPTTLTEDINTLRQAALSSVGQSDNQVAAILGADSVTAAQQHLVDYIHGCAPKTS